MGWLDVCTVHRIRHNGCSSENCSGRRAVTRLVLSGPDRVGSVLACAFNVSSSEFPLGFLARNRNTTNAMSVSAAS